MLCADRHDSRTRPGANGQAARQGVEESRMQVSTPAACPSRLGHVELVLPPNLQEDPGVCRIYGAGCQLRVLPAF